jgi:VWFA-related protein
MRTPLTLAAALIISAPLLAQPSAVPAPVATSVDVRVINVDVSVIDGSGSPVTDLTRDDFEILEDNQPQKITNFLQVNRSTATAPDARTISDFQFRRRMILLVDNNYIDKSGRRAAEAR